MTPARGPAPAATAHAAVKRELLVRYLDTATPALLHGSKRLTYTEGYAGTSAVAALRVFGEFADLLTGRRLRVVLVGAQVAALGEEISAVRAEVGLSAALEVDLVAGSCDEHLVGALSAAEAFAAPIVAYLDAVGADPPTFDTMAALAGGPSTDVLIALDPADLADDRLVDEPGGGRAGYPERVGRYRGALRRAGFRNVAHAELVDAGGRAELLVFVTTSDKGLDRFKDALWAVDEFAGVRYRDPCDDANALLDISLNPHLGPLRRALRERVRSEGPCTVAELRQYARTETIYRVPDATRAITALVSTGVLTRQPERGRLAADTLLRLA